MICGRYNHKVYVAYSTVYALGTILSMQISFVGFQPVQTSEHMMVSEKTDKLSEEVGIIGQQTCFWRINNMFLF